MAHASVFYQADGLTYLLLGLAREKREGSGQLLCCLSTPVESVWGIQYALYFHTVFCASADKQLMQTLVYQQGSRVSEGQHVASLRFDAKPALYRNTSPIEPSKKREITET